MKLSHTCEGSPPISARNPRPQNLPRQSGFSGDPLAGIGEHAWRELWEAARRYSTFVLPGLGFPVVTGEDAVCVLCQQPLAADAKDRLQRFERFIRDDTAAQAAKARQALNAAVTKSSC